MGKLFALTALLLAACGTNPNTNCFQQSCIPSGPCNCIAEAACTTLGQAT